MTLRTTFVQHIALTNSVRFAEDVYYFEYGGVRFKLVQKDPSKHSDALLTIVADDRAAQDRAFAVAGEFVSALGWSVGLPMAVEPAGVMSLPGDVTLEAAHCGCLGRPQFFTEGNVRGHSLSRIAAIETDEQRRALAIYREARSVNKAILSFLLYWQILDILPASQTYSKELARTWARTWVDAEEQAGRISMGDYQSKIIDRHLKGRSLGEYFESDCRHAIAHLQRYPWIPPLVLDDFEDLVRIRVSADVAKDLAERYIKAQLGLSKGMSLFRKGKDGFPIYFKDGSGVAARGYVLAYP